MVVRLSPQILRTVVYVSSVELGEVILSARGWCGVKERIIGRRLRRLPRSLLWRGLGIGGRYDTYMCPAEYRDPQNDNNNQVKEHPSADASYPVPPRGSDPACISPWSSLPLHGTTVSRAPVRLGEGRGDSVRRILRRDNRGQAT